MTPASRIYSVLLVSASEKLNSAIVPMFNGGRFDPVTEVSSVAAAQRIMSERDYDIVIINSPLPDDFGRKFAVDICTESERVALLLVKNEMYDDINLSMTSRGVLVARRPLSLTVMQQLIDSMCSVRERLRAIGKKTVSLEDKMEEIRLVNRAKWALIKSCSMTEDEAHRYIQKQAMDLCLSKKETAENILKTYG